MSKNTLTLGLEGKVSLGDYTNTLNEFAALVNELADEVAEGAQIQWTVEELYAGSASATFQGYHEQSVYVEKVITAYENVGVSIQNDLPFPYSPRIRRRVERMTDVLNGQITAIRFETEAKDSYITSKPEAGKKSPTIKYSIGSVKGIVQTLSSRGKLKFTIWDSIFDRAVSCYLKEGQEETMRGIWGKNAVVSGDIGRRPDTGIPIVIRNVIDVQLIPQYEPGSYREARGAISWEGEEKPEEVIRRLRDG
ncbi:MAG: hypothetical protein KIS85_00955 [Anaerolineales bacterium]|nr:hypothetical protein [Anaerolineales bacterium]